MIEVVFFDAGETLLHPHPSFAELFASTCTERGHEVSPDDVQRVQDELAPHLTDIAEEEMEGEGPLGASLSPVVAERFWTALYRAFLARLGINDRDTAAALYRVFSSASSYALFDDVHPVLDALAGDGYRLGLISNFEDWLEEMLVGLEVRHRFDTVVISGVVGVEKPDPRIYKLALEQAGVEAGRAVHIGDSPANDVEPAREVGINAVLLDRTGRYPSSGYPTIASLEGLPAVLEELQGSEGAWTR